MVNYPVVITLLSTLIVIFIIKQFRIISDLLVQKNMRRHLNSFVILFVLILSTYLVFGVLFLSEFQFQNVNSFIALLLLLTVIYISIFNRLAITVKNTLETEFAEIAKLNEELYTLNKEHEETIAGLKKNPKKNLKK